MNTKTHSDALRQKGLELISDAGQNFDGALKSSRYELDDLERLIVAHLSSDGRKPFQAIAREIGVDEKTVRNRFAKLREHGILQIIPSVNPDLLKGCIVAMISISINTDARKGAEAIAAGLSAMPCVSWVGITTGDYDLLAQVIVESWEELIDIEFVQLPKLSGIAKTNSSLIFAHYGQYGLPFVQNILKPTQ